MDTTKCESTKMVKLVEIYPEGVTKRAPFGRLRNKGFFYRLRTELFVVGSSRNTSERGTSLPVIGVQEAVVEGGSGLECEAGGL